MEEELQTSMVSVQRGLLSYFGFSHCFYSAAFGPLQQEFFISIIPVSPWPQLENNKIIFSAIMRREHKQLEEIMKQHLKKSHSNLNFVATMGHCISVLCNLWPCIHISSLPFSVLLSSDGGHGDWCRHRHSSHRCPHLLHLAEDPASKSVNSLKI